MHLCVCVCGGLYVTVCECMCMYKTTCHVGWCLHILEDHIKFPDTGAKGCEAGGLCSGNYIQDLSKNRNRSKLLSHVCSTYYDETFVLSEFCAFFTLYSFTLSLLLEV